jgi:hypothetical protein
VMISAKILLPARRSVNLFSSASWQQISPDFRRKSG